MKNNIQDDKPVQEVSTYLLESCIEKMNPPKWAFVKCPECKKEIHKSGLRSISLNFNARNIGDIGVEYFCNRCNISNICYFYSQTKDISDFCEYLLEHKEINVVPVVEEDMFLSKKNNLLDKLKNKELIMSIIKRGECTNSNPTVVALQSKCPECGCTCKEIQGEIVCPKCNKSTNGTRSECPNGVCSIRKNNDQNNNR